MWKHARCALLAAALAVAGLAPSLVGVRAGDLSAALLRPDDLPAGWSIGGSLDADAGLPPSCPSTIVLDQPIARAGIWLAGSDAAHMAYQVVMEYQPDAAEPVLLAPSVQSAACSLEKSLDNARVVSKAERVETPAALGADAVAQRLTMDLDGTVVRVEEVVIRRKERIAVIIQLALGDGSQLDSALTRRLALAADHRLAALDGR